MLLGVLAFSSGAVVAMEAPLQTLAKLETRLAAVLDQQNTLGLSGTLGIGNDLLWIEAIGLSDRATR